MSHFAVMVIGENVETQLQPYHEFECTGHDDQFVQDVDVTEETRELGLGWHGLEDKTVTDESQVDRTETHKYGFAVVDADGNLVKAINRTNPNKKWDWWTVGGRWSGFLKLKAGDTGQLGERGLMGSCANGGPGRADTAKIGDVDLAGMRDEAGASAAEKWDRIEAASPGRQWQTWEVIRTKHAPNYDAARAEYHGQPALQAAKAAVKESFFFEFDPFMVDRATFIQQARDRSTVLYAVVKDGQWFAKGEMGWFGVSHGDIDQSEWNRKVNELLDGLPPETTVTVVDCHI